MKKYVYISSQQWFESSSLKNPIISFDHKLEQIYPEYYNLNYDLKLLVTKPPSNHEKSMPFYNDFRERYGSFEIDSLVTAVKNSTAINVFLDGFSDEHLQRIAPLIKDTVEVLYLFKCTKIKDLSVLAEFENLKCVLIDTNNSLEQLWNMRNNVNLKVLSFICATKIKNVDSLINSGVAYVTLDSTDNNGNQKQMCFDREIFYSMPKLKHLTLSYKNCNISY